MYSVDDEWFEEDGTVGRGAGPFVNHNYSRNGARRDGGGEGEIWGEGGTTQTGMVRGRR